MEYIYNLLKNSPVVSKVLSNKGTIQINNIRDEAYIIASAFFASGKNIVVVKATQYEAQKLYNELTSMGVKDTLYFPVDESQRIEALAQSPELLAERLYTMYEIDNGRNHIIITHTAGVIRHLPTKELFKSYYLNLKVNQTISISELKQKLVEMGYRYQERCDQPFIYSNRGGVVDVYSIQYENPVRIEFFDDEIEEIRIYDKNSQAKISTVEGITIIPASDILYDYSKVEETKNSINLLKTSSSAKLDPFVVDDFYDNIAIDLVALDEHDTSFAMYKYYSMLTNTTSILSYISNKITVVSYYSEVNKNYENYAYELNNYSTELFMEGKALPRLNLYLDLLDVLGKRIVEVEEFSSKKDAVVFNARLIDTMYASDENIIRTLNQYTNFSKVLIVLSSESRKRAFQGLLDDHDVKYTLLSLNDPIYDGINIIEGNFNGGLELVDQGITIITEKELFNQKSSTKQFAKYKDSKILSNVTDLNVGDYVVHDAYGIGQYLGIKTQKVDDVYRDYLEVIYSGNSKLFVPVDQFQMIRKYSSKDGRSPKLNKLGGKDWQRTKARIQKDVDKLATELIELYAARMAKEGYAFSKDDVMQEEFEHEFPYELTPDQERSVLEIKEEMESSHPMDRLLCGDVGFGKTEVALRAAFKAILDHKQVAILCPTTILSQQHYRTIEERFKNFGINIALLNRFVGVKDTNKVISGLKDGSIDLVVGTHKILNDKIQYFDLGLLIIDEEQRFGVKHKEKIKKLKENIDVLTLSATPIPRTLQMSLMGIRSLSTIDTPPVNRLPVQTYVLEKSKTVIKQVIERELARGGQVFYLYNKTSNIQSVANEIATTIPGSRVGVGHGQMDKNDLEDVMTRFLNNEYNVLVCTTIIETGIDIPNANTLIVEDADHFGLSQLYQIRGRVGRSERNAYAYLMYRRDKQLTEEATHRLKAIKEFTQLGAGYKIAMRDLTIRGAGDILGGTQSGHIESIGYDMYMKILTDVLKEKKGIVEKEIPYINVPTGGYIPDHYVNTDLEKLNLYQTIRNVKSLKELNAIKERINDLFGKTPKEINAIINKQGFDILMSHSDFEGCKEERNAIVISFTKEASARIDGIKLFDIVSKDRDLVLSFTDGMVMIKFKKETTWLVRAIKLIQRRKEFMRDA